MAPLRRLGAAMSACGGAGLALAAYGSAPMAIAATAGVTPGVLLLGSAWWGTFGTAERRARSAGSV
ncbi:hypothetical protein ABZ746_22525 [Streptomyces sp. NPDC020096]